MSTQASNTTANYGLSQWAESDRILMDDFNHDNDAIDRALKANADSITETAAGQRLVKLADYTAASDTESINLDLGALNMADYATLQIYFRGIPNTSIYLWCKLNNSITGEYLEGGGSTVRTGCRAALCSTNGVGGSITLQPATDSTTILFSKACSYDSSGRNDDQATFCKTCGFDAITSIQIYATSNSSVAARLCAGFHLDVYGVRK